MMRRRFALGSILAVWSLVGAVACDASDGGGAPAGTSGTSGTGSPHGGAPTSACTSSATVTTLLSDVDASLGRVAIDDGYVYAPGHFAGGDGIERFPRAGGDGVPLATTPLPEGTVPDLVTLAGGDVYFVGASSGTLYKVPAAGNASTYTQVATGYSMFSQRRLVADADAVYLLTWRGQSAVLDRFPLAGGASQTLATLADGQWNLALFGSDVFVSGGKITDVGTSRIPKAGGAPERISGDQCLVGFAVTADAIFCASSTELRKMPRAGGGSGTMLYTATNAIDGIDDVVFDETASSAFVNDRMGQPNTKAARVSRVDTASGATTTLVCGSTPRKQMTVGPGALGWSGTFVGTIPRYDLQLVPR